MSRDPRVRRALAVGSKEIFEALERAEADGGKTSALRGKLLRYLIRMSTRPTPYGLFAGVGLARWGFGTDLALSAEAPAIQTRPDMEWLLNLVFALEARPEIRKHLRFFAHSGAFFHAGRVFLMERAPDGVIAAEPDPGVSIRAGQAVRRALALARTPIAYDELVDGLLSTPGATPEKAGRLIDQLWEQTVLLTDLRPPLTVASPAHHVLDRLSAIPAAKEACASVRRVLDTMECWDGLATERGPAAYRDLLALAGSAQSNSSRTPVQVDMALPLAGCEINKTVGEEAVRAAEMLLTLSPWPTGPPHLDAYRQAFEHRYGAGREVPLLELISPDFGLGPPALHGHSAPPIGIDAAAFARRQRTLRDMALDAIREHRQVVRLTDETLARLQTCSPEQATFPVSLDIALFVAAESPSSLDAGEFQIIVGPNIGAPAAGRNLGRFASLLGPEAEMVLRQAADAEETCAPDHLWAELSYLPHRLRSANVAVRPLVRDHEITVGATAGGPPERVIPVADLTVSVRDGRFRLWWPAGETQVLTCAGHMLNSFQAPAVCHFLDELTRAGVAQLSGFDWGPAADFPFLPRVERGRIILAPAQWRLDGQLPSKSPDDFARGLRNWQQAWQVPRYVYLTEGDNRLLLDLQNGAQVEQLRAAYDRGQGALLQEALPSPEQAWARGPEGHHVIELVVPMAQRGADASEAPRVAAPPTAVPAVPVVPLIPLSQRMRPPGSDWLFAKLYCPAVFADDLITGHIAPFCQFVCQSGLAEDWFFIRYSDPDFHVRLRFRGDPGQLTHELAPQLFSWASGLMTEGICAHFCLDTYEREMERYGGIRGTTAAEKLFCADSRAVADLLHLRQQARSDIDPTLLAMLNTDDLLAGLGLDEAQRLHWYGENVVDNRETGSEYRRRKRDFCYLLAHTEHPPPHAGGMAAADILNSRRRKLGAVREGFVAPHDGGEHAIPLPYHAASFVHLSCNRLSGSEWPSESAVLGLLLRARTALDRAPLQASAESRP
ncbi:lantibiotic dehydratase [Streptomyces galilaeus]|uniref:lantibiotic dehydratase n=1 Tax=Streptomyces galilaeus TaxID=33899 RepID=UPI00227D7A8F|nr:lantibiotic dehydratase [Streptomyces galilaeus]